MDDEEYTFQAIQEPLYRVETGNYEYRLILRCRQEAKVRFANFRSDVLVKLELLDQKHVQDIVTQLQKLLNALAKMYSESYSILSECPLFPLELDLSANCKFEYPDPLTSPYQDVTATGGGDDDDSIGGNDDTCQILSSSSLDLLEGEDALNFLDNSTDAKKNTSVDELLSLGQE